MTNVCKECKSFSDGYCERGKKLTGVDPVWGHNTYSYRAFDYAFLERGSILPWRCGKKGKFFVAKKEV